MRIHRVYFPELAADTDDVVISGQAAIHLVRVLRVKPNQSLLLFDGRGIEYQVVVTAVERKTVTAHIQRSDDINRESPVSITLIQSICRGERMDWLLQKATELGVSCIVPVYSRHSVTTLDDKRLQSRMLHWQSIIINACEQCGRNTLPELHSPRLLSQLLPAYAGADCYYFEPGSDKHLNQIAKVDHIRLIIGPEGGFDHEEKGLMDQLGVVSLSLGPRILRTETAGITAIAAIGTLWGDL